MNHRHDDPPTEVVSRDETPTERPLCSHKFVDTNHCVKCGVSIAKLRADSAAELADIVASQRSVPPDVARQIDEMRAAEGTLCYQGDCSKMTGRARPCPVHDQPQLSERCIDWYQSLTSKSERKLRSMNGLRRALDYRKGTKRLHRCSRCHAEIELAKPVLYDLSNQALSEPESHAPIMVGDQLLGFCCKGCTHSLLQHIASVFPESNGFPLVDHHGQLAPTPRCDECGSALAYGADGRSVVCPQCDTTPHASR